MSHYPPSILNLIKRIAKLPGIGEKTAERLAMHILRSPRKQAEQLSNAIMEAKEKVRLCKRCYGLSDDEFDSWLKAVQSHGPAGLRATAVQKYRQP